MKLHKFTGIRGDIRQHKVSKEAPIPRFVGIEVEVEGVANVDICDNMSLWERKSDGSLRDNGVELVTLPIFGVDLVNALEELNLFNKANPSSYCSSRCGLHIHVDMREEEVEALQKVLTTYLIVEKLLYNYCGADREDNPYCCPLTDSLLESSKLKNIFSNQEKDIREGLSQSKKYTGLNIKPLFRLGTIEFRMHYGTTDTNKILEWVNTILHMIDFAISFKGTPQDIINLVCPNPDKFILEVFRGYGIKTPCSDNAIHSIITGARNIQQELISLAINEPEILSKIKEDSIIGTRYGSSIVLGSLDGTSSYRSIPGGTGSENLLISF